MVLILKSIKKKTKKNTREVSVETEKDLQINKTICVNSFVASIEMKVCASGRSMMTQRPIYSRSSILLALAIFMPIVVVSLAENINTTEDVFEPPNDSNDTEYNLDIQTNFIDSKSNDNANDVHEIIPQEHIVIDLGNELPNNSKSDDNLNDNGFETTTLRNDVSIDKELHQNQNNSVDSTELNHSVKEEKAPAVRVTTELPTDGDTITTLLPINDNENKTNVITASVAEGTQHVELHTEEPEKLNDLSRFFEDEHSQLRQMRGSNKNTDTKIESDSISNSSYEDSHSTEIETQLTEDENKAAEDKSDLPLEKISQNENSIEQTTNPPLTNFIEEITGVTESTGEIQNDVTVVANVEAHTIMKKPGVDEESLNNSTEEYIEMTSTTEANFDIDPVVNLIVNRSKTSPDLPSSSDSSQIVDTTEKPSLSASLEISHTESSTVLNSKEESEQALFNNVIDDEPVKESNEIVKESSNEPVSPNDDLFYVENSTQKPLSVLEVSTEAVRDVSHSEPGDGKTLAVENSTSAPDSTFDGSSLSNNFIDEDSVNEKNEIVQESSKESMGPNDDLIYAVPCAEKCPNGFEVSTKSTLKNKSDESLKASNNLDKEPLSEVNSIPDSELENIETSTQTPLTAVSNESNLKEVQKDQIVKENKEAQEPLDESLPDPKLYVDESDSKPLLNPMTTKSQFATTTDYAQHVNSLPTMRHETSSIITNEVIAPASIGRSYNEIVAEGLGKPMPTRSIDDEPSSSSYSSEDKTTTVIVLCAAAGGIFVAFSFAIYLISFQRQNGVLDIEMQEQRCGKDNLDEDDDSETRVSLLNQMPTVDSDEHSSY